MSESFQTTTHTSQTGERVKHSGHVGKRIVLASLLFQLIFIYWQTLTEHCSHTLVCKGSARARSVKRCKSPGVC